MTSRDMVKRTVQFQQPPRIAHSLPRPWQNDFVSAGAGPDPDFTPSQPGEDEWGCVWEKIWDDDASVGQVKHTEERIQAMAQAFTEAESMFAVGQGTVSCGLP